MMNVFARLLFLFWALACMSDAARAQAAGVTFKNFRPPPPGRYTQTLTGEMNGQSSPPQRQTVCTTAARPDNSSFAAIDRSTAMSGCETRVLEDTERLAVTEQTCRRGNGVQTNRTTLRKIDDRTLTVDTMMRIAGGPGATSHSTVVYEGPCTAASAAERRPPPEECAELRASLADTGSTGSACADVPTNLKSQCQAQVAAGRRMAETALAQCR